MTVAKASRKREAYRSLWIQAHELLQCLGGCLKEVASHLVAWVEMGKPPVGGNGKATRNNNYLC